MKQVTAEVKSPLTAGATRKLAEFNTSEIIKHYKELYNIDVSDTFYGREKVDLYCCEESGYEFYYPFDVAGRDNFYRQLSVFDWYYSPWKWEHEQSLKYVAANDSVLEVGCGSGAFLKKLKQLLPKIHVTGLEITMSETSEKFIVNETIQEYVAKGGKQHDVVCSYQVLEHIADVGQFLEASVKALKTGGHLIISVPNNDSIFFAKRGGTLLNMPPHHMGLWNKRSLEYLTKRYPIKLVEVNYEPVQDYHFEWFKNLLQEKVKRAKLPLITRLMGNPKVLTAISGVLRKFYKGHSFMFVYKKL